MSDTPPSPTSSSNSPAPAPRADVPDKIKIPGRTQRNMALVKRWMRDTFSREQILSGLRQLAWVAPLTVLIWVWAEREQQVKAPGLRFKIQVAASERDKVAVRLREPSDGYVSLDLVGSRNRIEELRRLMGNPISFEVPGNRNPGEHQFQVDAIVRRDPRFAAVSVNSSSPSLVSVFVDPIQEEIIPIRVRDEDKELFEGVAFNPPKVRVRLPAEVKNKVKQGDQLFAVADLRTVVDRTPGRKQDVSGIRVYVPGAEAEETAIEPATVSVSLAAVDRAVEYTIKKVPVVQVVAPRLAEGKTISVDDAVMFNVKVIGPPEAIKEIQAKENQPLKEPNVLAMVMIDTKDVDAGQQRKTIQFSLPDGVKLSPDDNEQKPRTTLVTVTTTPPG